MFPFKKLLSSSGKDSNDIGRVILLLWLLIIIGLLSLLFPAIVKGYAGDWAGGFTTIGTGLFLAGAATLCGSILGFLFGVPKRDVEPKHPDVEPKLRDGEKAYQPNTNLEQISDWLTKIIVGVGLIEIKKIIYFFKTVGEYCGPAFGPSPSGEIIATSLTIHYILVGFIQGFLLAYLWLPGAFARAVASQKKQDETDKKV